MQFLSLPKLNIAYGSSLRRTVIGLSEQTNLVSHLWHGCEVFGRRSSSRRYRASVVCHNFSVSKCPADLPGLSLSCRLRRIPMAASGSQAVSGVDSLLMGHGSIVDIAKPSAVFFSNKRVLSCQIAVTNLRNRGRVDVSQRTWDSRPFFGPSLRNLHTSSSASHSKGAAANVPFGISATSEKLESPADSVSCKQAHQKSLKLLSGSFYLPHPDKVEKGGEDAHFICEEEGVIGVADGVGGWADVGVDAGEYARQLMSHSVSAIQEDSEGLVDPTKVLEKAHADTKVMGSSTACIIALSDQGIRAINLGDSGFIIIRNGRIVFRSPVQQYGFNFPYQLANGTGGDLPSSGQVFTFSVVPGDVIVAGTDGLFDNLYDTEIATLVIQAQRTGSKPQEAAHNIATLAQQRGMDRYRQTPFSTAALDAGFRYSGGKLDDVTVVISYVTASMDQ